MHRRRFWLPGAVALCLLAVLAGAQRGAAQTPQPAATSAADPGLGLQIAQRQQVTNGVAQQAVDVTITAAYPVQVRLFENRTTLLFDGFTADGATTITVLHARECGRRYSYDLYAIVGGGIAGQRTAALVLCPEAAPSPAATPARNPTAAPAQSAAPAPPPAAAAGAPPVSSRKPGEPPVPAPPLSPPGDAMASGFAVALPDDTAAANAYLSGTPYLRVLAIWLRGTDSEGMGGGDYQYVEIANLGGAAQELSGWTLSGDSGPISGLTYYFPDGFSLDAGASCRIYVGHPAQDSCTDGSFALYRFWGDHGTATLWDGDGSRADSLSY